MGQKEEDDDAGNTAFFFRNPRFQSASASDSPHEIDHAGQL